jgi:hypothetical protein
MQPVATRPGAKEQSSAPPGSPAESDLSSKSSTGTGSDTSGAATERSSAPPGSSAAESSKPNPTLNSSQQDQTKNQVNSRSIVSSFSLAPALSWGFPSGYAATADRGVLIMRSLSSSALTVGVSTTRMNSLGTERMPSRWWSALGMVTGAALGMLLVRMGYFAG